MVRLPTRRDNEPMALRVSLDLMGSNAHSLNAALRTLNDQGLVDHGGGACMEPSSLIVGSLGGLQGLVYHLSLGTYG